MKYWVCFGFAVALGGIIAGCGQRESVPLGAVAGDSRVAVRDGGAAVAMAEGVLVDDPSGAPLGKVPVRLYRWRPCVVVTRKPERLRCPNAVVETETGENGKFRFQAPAGHYLLVIGSDSTADLTRPTIHDNVTLHAGFQHLKAPGICTATIQTDCLPPIPLVTPKPMELDGRYRLVTINERYERPCIRDYDKQRTARGIVSAIVDEWLLENIRDWVGEDTSPGYHGPSGVPTPEPGEGYGALTTGNALAIGGSNCSALVLPPGVFGPSALKFARNPQTLWFAGRYDPYGSHGKNIEAVGAGEFPIDPTTAFRDPNVAEWP